jgi:hypothetical protein
MDSVVAGDFNTTLSQIDRSGKSKHVHDKAVESLLNIMNDKQLCDVWINRNLYCIVYSRKQIVEIFLTQSRLDYFLVSEELKPMVKNIYYNDSSISVHSIVNMKINLSNVEKGPGVWIFNNSFLQDECYVSKIRKIFADEIGSEFYGIILNSKLRN